MIETVCFKSWSPVIQSVFYCVVLLLRNTVDSSQSYLTFQWSIRYLDTSLWMLPQASFEWDQIVWRQTIVRCSLKNAVWKDSTVWPKISPYDLSGATLNWGATSDIRGQPVPDDGGPQTPRRSSCKGGEEKDYWEHLMQGGLGLYSIG